MKKEIIKLAEKYTKTDLSNTTENGIVKQLARVIRTKNDYLEMLLSSMKVYNLEVDWLDDLANYERDWTTTRIEEDEVGFIEAQNERDRLFQCFKEADKKHREKFDMDYRHTPYRSLS
jgi:hypothetical protein